MAILKLSEFTRSPGPRYASEGPFSGEQWRREYLLQAFTAARARGEILQVDLDDVDGFASSFLEEAFGGLVRESGLTWEIVAATLDIQCTDEPDVISRILERYLPDATKAPDRRLF